jgi:hypothetical protein
MPISASITEQGMGNTLDIPGQELASNGKGTSLQISWIKG